MACKQVISSGAAEGGVNPAAERTEYKNTLSLWRRQMVGKDCTALYAAAETGALWILN
jgi:hypothetical protein